MKNIILYFIAILSISLLVACSPEPEQLNVAYQNRVGDSAAILAAQQLNEDEAFSFSIFSSGSMTAEALLTGSADVATMGDAAAVALASRYPEMIRIIGIHGQGYQRHKIISTTKQPETIAVKFGTSTHAALTAYLKSQTETRVPELINLSPDLQIDALISGEIEAMAASEPTPSIALEKIIGAYSTPIILEDRNFPLAVVSTRGALEQKPELISEFILALKSASSELKDTESVSSQTRSLLSEVTGLEPGILMASLAEHQFEFSPPYEYIEELGSLSSFLVIQKQIPNLPDWEKVLTDVP
jgi:sulfonate transport system substrate-binding protein